MTRLFVDPAQLLEDNAIVSDADHRYLVRVLRLGVGDQIVLFDGKGVEADARILRIGPRAVELKIEARRDVTEKTGAELILIQSLTKGDKFEVVLQKATELGVTKILPVTSARSIQRLDATRALGRQVRWRKIVKEAARQSGRSDVPTIEELTPLETALKAMSKDALRLIFWEGLRQKSLKADLPAVPPPAIAIAIGPEGGFTTLEIDTAKEIGFIPAGLGPRTLRTETASIVALAVVGFALGDLA